MNYYYTESRVFGYFQNYAHTRNIFVSILIKK